MGKMMDGFEKHHRDESTALLYPKTATSPATKSSVYLHKSHLCPHPMICTHRHSFLIPSCPPPASKSFQFTVPFPHAHVPSPTCRKPPQTTTDSHFTCSEHHDTSALVPWSQSSNMRVPGAFHAFSFVSPTIPAAIPRIYPGFARWADAM
ncbi:hypothetical protein CC80DRAFT_42171 [Byssothecium circinans]|uniref:Uncharacterized protein n=1 Tax=Byssothecium circinans TaxID=147558 RepID=A0A6A5U871_9PLEO|nr:hypothetical protein CC80DRAFT_42171 [Byssothecium circinans]